MISQSSKILRPCTPQAVVIPCSHSCDRAQEAVKGSVFLVSVKQSRTIFKLGNSSQDVKVLYVCIAHSVVKCVRSNSQGPVCGAVTWSRYKNDGQFFAPGRTPDYSAYRSDQGFYTRF